MAEGHLYVRTFYTRKGKRQLEKFPGNLLLTSLGVLELVPNHYHLTKNNKAMGSRHLSTSTVILCVYLQQAHWTSFSV